MFQFIQKHSCDYLREIFDENKRGDWQRQTAEKNCDIEIGITV